MANILNLALKVNADASGLPKALTPAERALESLGKQVEKATSVFAPLAEKSAAAAIAQEQFADKFATLADQLRAKVIAPQEYAAAFGQLTAEAKEASKAFEEGIRITQQNALADADRAAKLERLNELLQLGAIDARNFGLETAKLGAEGGTETDRFAEAIAPLLDLLQRGKLSAEEFAAQSQEIAAAVASATPASERTAAAILELADAYESGRIKIEEYRDEFSRIQSGDIKTTFELQVVGVREGIEAGEELRAAISNLADAQIKAAVEVSGTESLDALRAQFAEIDGTQIDALLRVLGVESIEEARLRLDEIDGLSATAVIQTAGLESVDQAKQVLDSLQDKNVTATAQALGVDSIERLTQIVNAAESRTITVDVESNADEEANRVADLVAEHESYKRALEEGARLTERYRTEEEKRATELQKIQDLLERQAISEETAARARADATGEAAKAAEAARLAAEAERELARAKDEAARIIEASLSATEKAQLAYDQAVENAQRLEAQGVLTKEQLNTEIERQANIFAKAAIAAGEAGEKAEEAGLKLNEVSGFLGLLPGPIGSVASRISSLASSAEGLGKILDNPAQAVAGFTRSIAFLATPTGIATAALAGLGAAAAGLKSLEGELESLTNTANRLGVSFQFVETLKQSAEQAGVSFGTVNTAMTRLLRTLAGADEESKKAANSLKAVGLSFDDIKDKSSEEQIRLIGERLNAIEDPAKRAAAATAVFGRAGAELLPAFANLESADQILARFNARINDLDRNRILALGDSFDAVSAATRGFGNEVLTPFIGVVQSLSDGFASTIAAVGRNVGALLDALSPIASVIGGVINAILQFGSVLTNAIGIALEPFAAIGRTISAVFDAQSRAITELFGRVNDAIISFREFFKFNAAAEALNKIFTQLWNTLERVITIVTTAFAKLGDVIGRVISDTVGTVGEFITQILEFTGLSGVVSDFTTGVASFFSELWADIKFVVDGIGGFIEQVLKFAEDWLGIVPKIEEPVEAEIDVNTGGAIEELLKESKDFKKTLDDITGSVSKAIDESAKFGQAGFDAAVRYQTAVDELKDKLDRGLFNEETFRREAAKAGEAFQQEISRIEEQVKFDLQESEETRRTLDGLQGQINKAIEGAQQFGRAGFDAAQQFQDKLKDLGQQFEDGRINAATLAQETEKATAEYNKQIDGLKRIEELQKSIIKADQDRVSKLIEQQDKTTDLERNIEAVQREQLRLEAEIQEKRKEGSVFAADAATARLAQLDQLQAKLADEQQAVEQGFTDGFTKSFETTNKAIDGLIVKAEQFGNIGALAAEALRQGVQSAQRQAEAGILTQETYNREIEKQRELFADRLAAAKRVEDFMLSGLDARQRAELEAAKKLEERKKQAAVNVQAIEAQLQAERQKNEEDREKGRIGEARAGAARIRQLEQAQQAEKKIAASSAKTAAQQGRTAAQQQRAMSAFSGQQQRQFQQFQSTVGDYLNIANASLRAVDAVNAELARQEALQRPVSGSVSTADIRTAEGAALVLGLGTSQQDPALIEARLQTKQLAGIRTAITNAVAGYLNTPVEIF